MNITLDGLIDFGYLLASVLFIMGIKLMGRQESARKGNLVSAVGMLVAVVSGYLPARRLLKVDPVTVLRAE